jgi:hypothetical protein
VLGVPEDQIPQHVVKVQQLCSSILETCTKRISTSASTNLDRRRMYLLTVACNGLSMHGARVRD